MPVEVRRKGGKYRLVEAETGEIAKTPKGNPRDGGGHKSRGPVAAQARIINEYLREKGRI